MNHPIPTGYEERVYAGVLGKIIGVYLGRPFEQWSHAAIMERLGPVEYYVHERLGRPLVVTDDDISGTFAFVRALADWGNGREITAAQIGRTWLNYIIENRTILWWGGFGQSTEHTAFIRLKQGFVPPTSGSVALNGRRVAEEIGSQIFIDGWALVAPGNPDLAAELAGKAAGVSHGGEAIYGAQFLAAMEAAAFVESDTRQLIASGLRYVPAGSEVRRMIGDVCAWAAEDDDWQRTLARLVERYGYAVYGTNCPLISNLGVILLALLHGGDDFDRALMIVNTCGYDTDCNSGNLGCLLGIKLGLDAFGRGRPGEHDWRGPVADRLYVPTAEGGRGVSDAATEAAFLVGLGRALAGAGPLPPKGGARFHFAYAGSVQGFAPDAAAAAAVTVANAKPHPGEGDGALVIRWAGPVAGARVETDTFLPAAAFRMDGYSLSASPLVYPGQTLAATVSVPAANRCPVEAAISYQFYGAGDEPVRRAGPPLRIVPGTGAELRLTLPDLDGMPICKVGLAVAAEQPGAILLDRLGWDGRVAATFRQGPDGGAIWWRSWVDAADHFRGNGREFDGRGETFDLIQNPDRGRGLAAIGTRDWVDYEVETVIRPRLCDEIGIAARFQGLGRYYALVAGRAGGVRLVKVLAAEDTLAAAPWAWELNRPYRFALRVRGDRIEGLIDGRTVAVARDDALGGGGIAIIVGNGRAHFGPVGVRPAG